MATKLGSTMKAVQWSSVSGGLEKNLSVNTSAAVPPQAKSLPRDSALVSIAYGSLNPADYKLPEIPNISSLLFSKTSIPSSDFSGIVLSTTRSDLDPGQRVFGLSRPPNFGALAEYIVVSGSDQVLPLPDYVNLLDAAPLGVAAGTAYDTIVPFIKRDSGAKVFINGGSGGVGTYGVQIAKALGCYVTATCSGPNVELVKSLGADEVINYRETDVIEQLKKSGTQYDLLVDYVWTPSIYYSAHHYLKQGGHFVTIAGQPTFLGLREMLSMFLCPSWLGGGQRTPKFVVLSPKASMYGEITRWMQEGKIKTVIEETYEMENAGAAFSRLKSGRTRGKLIVKVRGG